MESSCDIGGSKYSRPVVDREMKSSRVGLSPRSHQMIELGDDPRIIELMRHHKVHLPMKISIPAANIPHNGVAREVRSPDDGPWRQVWGSGNTLIRWRGRRPGSRCR